MAEKTTFPKIPESSWWALRRQFTKSLPTTVTPGYLMSLLGVAEGAAKNLTPPLKQIGLIDEDGKPTLRANDWRSDNKYDEVCDNIVRGMYPEELRDLFSGPDIDKDACVQWFMYSGQLGESAASMAASMYILLHTPLNQALEAANKKSSTAKSNGGKSRPNGKSVPAKSVSAVTVEIPTSEVREQAPVGVNQQLRPQPTVHIDLQIHISPEADAEQIDNIFASIAKHLYNR